MQTCDRDLQTRGLLTELIGGITAARSALSPSPNKGPPKLVLKIAPDLTDDQIKAIAEVLVESWTVDNDGIDGVIVSNTTISRPTSLADRELRCLLKSTPINLDCVKRIGTQLVASQDLPFDL